MLKIICFVVSVLGFAGVLPGQVTPVFQNSLDGTFEGVSPNGRYTLLKNNSDVRILDLKTGAILVTFKSPYGTGRFLPDNRSLVWNQGGEVQIVDILSGTVVNRIALARDQLFAIDSENAERIILGPEDQVFNQYLDVAKKRIPIPDEKNDSVTLVGLPRGNALARFETDFVEIISMALRGDRIAVLGATAQDTGLAVYRYQAGRVQREKLHRITEMMWMQPGLSFSSTGKYVTYVSNREKYLNMLDVETGQKLAGLDRLSSLGFTFINYRFSHNDERFMMLAAKGTYPPEDSMALQVFDLVSGNTILKKKVSGIYFMGMNPDLTEGTFAFSNFGAFDPSPELHILDLSTGELKRKVPTGSGSIRTHLYTPNGQFLIYLRADRQGRKALTYHDVKTGTAVREIPLQIPAFIRDIDYLPRSKELLITSHQSLQRIDISRSLHIERLPFDTVLECAVSERAGKIALLQYARPEGMKLSVYALDGNKKICRVPLKNEAVSDLQLSPDGRLLSYQFYYGDKDGERSGTAIVDARSGREVGRFPTNSADIFQYGWWSHTGKWFYNICWAKEIPTGNAYRHGTAYSNLAVMGGYKMMLQRINPRNGRITASYEIKGGYYNISQLDIIDHFVIIGTDDPVTPRKYPVTILDGSLRAVKKHFFTDWPFPPPERCFLYPDAGHLTFMFKQRDSLKNIRTATYDLVSGEPATLVPATAATKNLLGTPLNEDMLIEGIYDIQLSFFDVQKGGNYFSLALKGTDDYLFATPENYYWATREATNGVRFTRNGTSFPLRQYDLWFNRPDKVLARLNNPDTVLINRFYRSFQERLKKLNVPESALSTSFSAPTVRILTPDIPFATTDSVLDLAVEAADTTASLKRFNIWVNDIPLFGRKGLPLAGQQAGRAVQKFRIPLSSGKNLIQISCTNVREVESLVEEIDITLNGGNKKGDLYLVAIGASQYADASMNLPYAVPDAQSVEKMFRSRPDLYDSIYVKTIYDRDVTADTIKGLKTWMQKTGVDDQVILFYAGHGQAFKDEFFLATYDLDFKNPGAKGMSYTVLEWLFDSLAARRQLILLDACESGELDQGAAERIKAEQTSSTPGLKFRSFKNQNLPSSAGAENYTDLMKALFVDLRRGTGTVVIAAAGGLESAIEGDGWKNGVFTYSLVKGLTQLEADGNRDGRVTITELQAFLSRAVSQATNGLQKPVFRAENVANDWQIW